MFGLSKQQTKLLLTHRCPACRAAMIGRRKPDYFKGDGTRIAAPFNVLILLTLLWDRSAVAECPQCHQRWSVFHRSEPSAPRQQELDTLRVDAIVETSRSEELLGEEQRIVDNSKSAIALERRFTVTKEWSQFCTLEHETTRDIAGGLAIGVPGVPNVASITASAKEIVTAHYAISEETKRTYTEEITLRIPAKTKLTVNFSWKRIWQHGVIKVYDEKGMLHELQFKVAVGLTFDQAQVDA